MRVQNNRGAGGKAMRMLGLVMLGVFFWGGQAYAGCLSSSVSTASTPSSNFTDNGDGTVTDTTTGLTWMRCSEGQTWDQASGLCAGTAATYTWQGALQLAQSIDSNGGYAGHSDWRVPNIKELNSIVETQCTDPAINTSIFPVTPSSGTYWSSSPYGKIAGNAWMTQFSNGIVYDSPMSTAYSVRLVRGGQ